MDTPTSPAVPPPTPPAPETKHRPRGKIARLPPPMRRQINILIDERITYAEIITALGPEGQHITESDISRWYKSGFQEWLKNQIWLENTRARLDMAIDVLAENDGSNVHQANLQIAATQLIQDLIDRGQQLLSEHPDQYVSLVNSTARLSREALNFQKYREACALARAELAKFKDPNRKLSEAETLAIVDRLDHILGFK